ncbi:MAG TPA: tetratricopeptide repeat protein [Candidatus Binatia bacterium]|nr:tetratricopeptide repeat protein [Candidatus Binatia bacterium]
MGARVGGRSAPAGPAAAGRPCVLGALLVLLILLAYVPAVRDGYVWDDDVYVTDDLALRSPEGLRRIWLRPTSRILPQQYYPVTYSVLWLEYRLWHRGAAGYHVVNVALHAASAVLLWRLFGRLGFRAPWVAAAVWALHPVMVESVAWVTEVKNVLSGVFYLAAGSAYLRFAALPARPGRRGVWYAAALILFLAALLAKSVTCTLPAALALILWWKRGRLAGRDVVPLVPFLVAGLALGAVTVWMERARVGAVGPEWNLTAVERLLVAGRALWFYAGKLLWPARLSFNYARWSIDPRAAGQWILPAAAAAALAGAFAARRTVGRGPLAALLFFAGTLGPALGFFNVYPMRYAFVADHFQYLAAIGVVGAVIEGAAALLPSRRARTAASAIVITALAVLTSRRARVFASPETLWRDTLAGNASSWLAHGRLATFYSGQRDFARAVAEAEAAAARRPHDAQLASLLGITFGAAGRTAEARRAHEQALAIDAGDPLVHYNYGYDLEAWGELEAAEREYRDAMRLDPRALWGERTRLGHLLAARGDAAGAEELYRQELALAPESPTAGENLAALLLAQGRLDEAQRVVAEVLGVDPENGGARSILAVALLERGDRGAAERELRRALRDAPAAAEIHNTLGSVLMQEGRREAGIAEYEEALRLRPDYPSARRNLEAAGAQGQGTPGGDTDAGDQGRRDR